MTRKHRKIDRPSGRAILVVDDNPTYLDGVRLLLEDEGHQVYCVTNGPEALELLRRQPVDLVLLDYFMPGMTGEEVVTRLRAFNPYVQVILQTGYASENPPRELLQRLDIQGYYNKSEGADKLLLWTEVGLKAAYTVQLLTKSRQGLRYILKATPEMHRVQPLTDLLQGILWQVSSLLGSANSFLAVMNSGGVLRREQGGPDSFLALLMDDTDLLMCAGTGRFAGQTKIDGTLEPEKVGTIRDVIQHGETRAAETSIVLPLRVGALTLGVIYLDQPPTCEQDTEILEIFANQAAAAIQNVQLYEMATLDPLTGVYVRRLFEQWLMRELRTAFRSRQPLALLMLDLDGMKLINDQAGHLVGDQALASLGRALRHTTRESDIVGRYGGDEFAVLLPQTGVEGAERLGRRLIEFLQDKSVPGPEGDLPLRCSIGLCVLDAHSFAEDDIPRPVSNDYFFDTARSLIGQADEALYQSKRAGGHSIHRSASINWAPLTGAAVTSTAAATEQGHAG